MNEDARKNRNYHFLEFKSLSDMILFIFFIYMSIQKNKSCIYKKHIEIKVLCDWYLSCLSAERQISTGYLIP